MTPPEAVRKLFKSWENEWRSALDAWQKRCKGMSEQLHTLERTGGLVAQATRSKKLHDPDAPKADAELPAPPGLSPETADRLEILRKADSRCEQNLKRIKQTIKRLEEAQHTGSWWADAKVFGVRRDPKFVSPVLRHVSRGESVVVIEKQGEWLRVRTQAGEEGWVEKAEIQPRVPVLLNSKPGETLHRQGMTDEEAMKAYWEQEQQGTGMTPEPRG